MCWWHIPVHTNTFLQSLYWCRGVYYLLTILRSYVCIGHEFQYFTLPPFLQELKLWGIKTGTHRRKIIASKDSVIKRDGSLSTQSSVEQDGCSPPLFTSQSPPTHPHQIITRQLSRQLSQGSGNSGSQNSQISSSSAAAYSQSFEVVQIQLKKKISSSSSSGSSQNNGRRWTGTLLYSNWFWYQKCEQFSLLSFMRLHCPVAILKYMTCALLTSGFLMLSFFEPRELC